MAKAGSARRLAASTLLVALLTSLLTALVPATPASAAFLPTGFTDVPVLTGLTEPTNFRFAPDGRIFVAEKSGLIKVFQNLNDTNPTIFADLRVQVDNFWDRGMLGMVLDPSFPTRPYVYVLYTRDADIGGTAPKYGSSDPASYASGGEGSNFNADDYGQFGSPNNPCGDPPGGVGGTMNPPTAEGGALRAQSVRRATSEPAVLNGALTTNHLNVKLDGTQYLDTNITLTPITLTPTALIGYTAGTGGLTNIHTITNTVIKIGLRSARIGESTGREPTGPESMRL